MFWRLLQRTHTPARLQGPGESYLISDFFAYTANQFIKLRADVILNVSPLTCEGNILYIPCPAELALRASPLDHSCWPR